MQSISGVALENIINIGEAYIPFEDKFVCVIGHNKDSRISATQNNASGKSTLFSSIANILYESDPMSSASTKNRKAMLQSTDSKIQIDLKSQDGSELTVVQTANKYYCSSKQDGDLKPHKISDAQNIIRQHFPITEEEFYAYCYINGNKPFAFQHSKETERFKFLAKLFRLDVYDVIRAHVKKERDEANKSKIQFDAMAEHLTVLKKQLEANGYQKGDDKKAAEYDKAIQTLSNKSTALLEEKAVLDTQCKYHDAIKKQKKILAKAKSIIGDREISKNELRKLTKLMKLHEQYEEYQEQLAAYKKEKQKITSKLDDLGSVDGIEDIEELRTRFSELDDQLSSLEDQLEDVEDIKEQLTKLYKRRDKIKERLKKCPKTSLKQVRKELAEVEQILDVADRVKNHSECPTCGQSIDLKKLAKKAKTAKTRRDELEDVIQRLELQDELISIEEDIEELKPNYDIDKKIKSYKAKIKETKSNLAKTEKVGKKLSKFLELSAQLKALKKPTKVSKPKALKDIEDVIDAMRDAINADNNLRDMPKTSFDSKRYDVIVKKLKKINKEYEKTRRIYVELNVKTSQHKHLSDQIENSNKQMDKLRPIVDRINLLTAMYKLYGKELKSTAINDRLQQLEKIMNANAHLVFSERMIFSFKAEGDKVIARVQRESGISSDISKMSGSESNCFRMLFAYSLLPILPSERRTNFMILDEPDAACDPEVRDHVVKNFVPHLRASVPNVFWLTPKEISGFDGCEIWQIVKENGISTLNKVER